MTMIKKETVNTRYAYKILVGISLSKRPLLTQNKTDMALLVNTLWKYKVDFAASNYVIQ
jgi:hypothetical protein